MKKIILKAGIAAMMLLFIMSGINAQKTYTYESVPNDPLNVRIYTLNNGMKVYLTVYKDAPRIQTAIAVRTGSKNDPSDNTGMSHYLEHMMFKGSDEFGTMDYAKEKPVLDRIEDLFDLYKKTSDTAKRRAIYHEIDSISQIASTYAIANEYDKLLSVIGAKGTNAFTGFEQTVYINDIPSNKIKPWLEIELERFRDPVFRLFHTELETVYEEKNMSLDSDDDKISEELFAGLFPTNTYGTQTVIGTVDHLKNPSLTSLKEYYASRYVPNNMAIILSGDFNPDEVIRMIDGTFGRIPAKQIKPYLPAVERPFTAPVVKNVLGPDAESVTIGYRLGGSHTEDADMVTLLSEVLSNGTAGLIDLNLIQEQKVLEANAYAYVLTDYSVQIFSGKAKEGQTLEEVKDLILAQVEKVKAGEFPEWLITGVINKIKLRQIREQETNSGRVFSILDGFINDEDRKIAVEQINRMAQITKAQLVDFTKRNFQENYVVVYKRTGVPEEPVKVIKPEITPVTMNRDAESEFLKKIMKEPSAEIEPVFLDYEKDIQKFKTSHNIPVWYVRNNENQTFNLTFYFQMGNNHNKVYGVALDYLQYLGTSKYTPKEIKEEFFKLGCSFNANATQDEVRITLSGLNENMAKGVELLEHLLSDVQPNLPALENLVADILKSRTDDKLNKNTILWSAMYNYGVYGEKSPFTNILSEADLKNLKADELLSIIKDLKGFEHKVLYYGPLQVKELTQVLDQKHIVTAPPKPVPAVTAFNELDNAGTKVFTVDYDMKQVEIIMLSKSNLYKKDLVPVIRLFNEYFGGSMNSIVFQEIRESKGLAYSAYGGYRGPAQPWLHYYIFSYIGTQNDKLPEAMKTMLGIFNNTPESDKALNASKEAIINKIRTERITKANILNNYLQAQRFGLTYDIRKDVFEQVPKMKFSDLRNFQEKNIRDKNYTIMVLGKTGLLDMKTLEGYGPVKTLKPEDIFNY